MEIDEQIRLVEDRVARLYANMKQTAVAGIDDEITLAEHIRDQLQVLRMLKAQRNEQAQCHTTTTFH